MDYEQELDEYSERHMSRGRKIFGKCVKYFFYGVLILIIGVFLWRVFLSDRVPREIKTLLVNDATYAAYVAEGDTLTMYTQPQDPLIVNGDSAGYFWVMQAVFIPEAEQVQILVRYNNSTLEHIGEDFKLDHLPAREDEVLDVTLRMTSDPTPADATNEDATSARYYASAAPVSDSTGLYNYRKYIFDGVTVDADAALDISVDFYYIGQLDYESAPYGSLLIYDRETDNEPLTLTARDKKALAAYAEANQ